MNYLSTAEQETAALRALSSLSTTKAWNQKSETMIALWQTAHAELKIKGEAVANEATRQFVSINSKSFFARVFSSEKTGLAASNRLAESIRKEMIEIEMAIEELRTGIELSPNDKDESKLIQEELKLRKKELQLEKRALNEAMRSIRANARDQSATAPFSLLGLAAGAKYTAVQRRSIVFEKQSKLKPHESQKAALERQILEVDRLLIWHKQLG
jgi:hypothetical protein